MPVASAGRSSCGCGRTRPPDPGNEAPEATGVGAEALDVISVSPVLTAPSGTTNGTAGPLPRSTDLSTNAARVVGGIHEFCTDVDEGWTSPTEVRRRRTGQPPIANISIRGRSRTSPRSAARSNDRRGPARRRACECLDHSTSPPSRGGPPGGRGPPRRRGTCRAGRRRTAGHGCSRRRTAGVTDAITPISPPPSR